MQDSIFKSTPLENAADFRHDPDEKYLEPLYERDLEADTTDFEAIETFASSAGELLSVKIYGLHHSVKRVTGSFYIVSSPENSDYANTFLFHSEKRGIVFVKEEIAIRMKLKDRYDQEQARMLRARHVAEA